MATSRLTATLNHWRGRYRLVGPGTGSRGPALLEGDLEVRFEASPGGRPLEEAVRESHPIAARVFGPCPLPGLTVTLVDEPARRVVLDPRVLSPAFLVSPWGSLVPDAIDWALGRGDWRAPLPPLVSARIDDVTGAGGLGWLRAFEAHGLLPSIGTLHDVWLASGEEAVRGLAAASRRGASVGPHAFDMDRFIWFDAVRARPFTPAEIEHHRVKIARDVAATGLVLGKTLNAHFDVVGSTAVPAARALGYEFMLGEHVLDQDWREPPRARGPLGSPLHAYGELAPGLFGYQAEGAIASSAAPGSRYDWLRNFVPIDRRTNRPVREGFDRAGAVAQGVSQLLSSLHAGFPAYLLAHEIQLDALGEALVGELVDEVLREVRARHPGMRLAPFDELPRACRG